MICEELQNLLVRKETYSCNLICIFCSSFSAGKLSCSFAKRGNLSSEAQINDYLRHWLMFRAARILVDLSAHCVRCLPESAAESCMNALTESISSYNPYFDWVVAHVGSCFPSMVITRLLNWGLKDFCVTGIQKPEHNQVLNSVVGILGHLAGSHFYEIRTALLELFKASDDPRTLHIAYDIHIFLYPLLS